MTPMKFVLPYVKRDVDRYGTVRYYSRRRGFSKVRLPDQPGTVAFMAAYEAALGGAKTEKPRSAIGTFEGLGRLYFSSVEFKRLNVKSQSNRRSILQACFEEPRRPGAREHMGECPAALINSAVIRVLRDRKADTPGAANNRLKYLSSLFSWAIEAGHMRTNPARDIKRIRFSSDGFHMWTEAEIRKFEENHPRGTKPRLALDLLLYTGARRGDIVRFGRQNIKNGWFSYVPRKTSHVRLDPVEFPIGPALATALENAPKGELTFLLTEYGKPFTPAGFGNWFRARCDEAGLPQCSAHGLRKAGAARLAEGGATDRQLMARFGWSSAAQATTYTKRANQRTLAAAAGSIDLGCGQQLATLEKIDHK